MSVKSCVRRFIETLSILPSWSAMTWAICASVPGSLIDCRAMRAGKRCGSLGVDVPAHVDPAVGLVVEGGEGGRLDRVDRDALAGRQDADDAVSRHGAAIGREAHRQVVRPAPRIGIAAGRRRRSRLHLARLRRHRDEPAAFGDRPTSARRSSLKSGIDRRTTSPENISPRPTAASTSSIEMPREAGQRGLQLLVARRPWRRARRRARGSGGRGPYIAAALRRASRGGSRRGPCR